VQALVDAPGWHECPPYNHRCQAGSVADCFKHVFLVMLLRLLLRESNAPLAYVDTHAGGGVYDLSSIEALQERRFEEGITRMVMRATRGSSLPEPLEAFLDVLQRYNATMRGQQQIVAKKAEPQFYLGSAALAQCWLRSEDVAVLFETSEQAQTMLRLGLKTLDALGRMPTRLLNEDGYSGLRRLCPELSATRGLVFIDPPYELSFSDQLNMSLLRHLYHHWPTSSLALWHPIRDESRTERVYQRLRASHLQPMLATEFEVGSVKTGCCYFGHHRG